MATDVKTAADLVEETTAELRNQHTAEIKALNKQLCICGVADLLVFTGAIGIGVVTGYLTANLLQGRWRFAPFVAGSAMLVGAWALKPDRHRFAHKASLTMGGLSLMGANVGFTFMNKVQQEEQIV